MNIDVPISEVSNKIHATITITGMKRWNLRMRLTLWLIQLAAWVAPINMSVEVDQ